MRIFFFFLIVPVFLACGCAGKASSGNDAILQSQQMKSVRHKYDYLIGQARIFMGRQQYADAVKTARYILSSIDSTSEKAKDVLFKSQEQMAGQVRTMVRSL